MNTEQGTLWIRIQNINLDPIRFNLANRDEGEGSWEVKKIDEVETHYRQFLFLTQVAESSCSLVPSLEIDQFWHTHILDTSKYMEDCQNAFGCYLHHFPYFRVSDKKGQSDLMKAFLGTALLFEEFFGEIPSSYSCTEGSNSERKSKKAHCCGMDFRQLVVSERPALSRAA